MTPQLPIADGAHGRHIGCRSPRARSRLTSSTNPSSTIASKRARSVMPKSGRSQETSARARIVGLRAGSPGALQHPCLPARQRMDLERTLDALPVAGSNPHGGRPTTSRNRSCSAAQPRAEAPVDLGANVCDGTRQRRQTFAQRAQIEQRASDEQRQPPTSPDRRDETRCVAREPSCRVRLHRLQNVDEMMRHAVAYRRRRLRRTDVETAIHHRRIHADDFDRYVFREGEREIGLAARRRPRDADALDPGALAHELLTAQE